MKVYSKAMDGTGKPPVKVRDMSSAFALFGIAILINYIAIKLLPPLDFIESLPEEE